MFSNTDIIKKVFGPHQEDGLSKKDFALKLITCMNMARKYPFKRDVSVEISECDVYISIHVSSKDPSPMSWEQLQDLKDSYYEDLDFVEVYPKADEIVNKSNVRHLIHIKNFDVPKLSSLGRECYINSAETII